MLKYLDIFVLLLTAGCAVGLRTNETRLNFDLCKSSTWTSFSEGDTGTLYGSKTYQSCMASFISDYKCRFVLEPQDDRGLKTCLRIKYASENACDTRSVDCDVIYSVYENDLKNNKTFSTSDDVRWFTSRTNGVTLTRCPSPSLSANQNRSLIRYTVKCYSTVSYVEWSTYYRAKEGTIKSPTFPRPYLANGFIHYYQLVNYNGGRIKLSFDDWNFDAESSIWVYSGTSSPLPYYGTQVRPFILSEGNDLVIEFHISKNLSRSLSPQLMNNYMGFKAHYVFLDDFDVTWEDKPTLVSEKYLYNLKGTYSLSFNGCSQNLNHWVDYLWVVPKTSQQSQFQQLKLTLGDLTILDDEGDSLEIRQGNSSLGTLVSWTGQQSIYLDTKGFYIRLRQQCTSSQRKFSADLEWTKAESDCSDGVFYCTRGGIICRSQMCNGKWDCNDGSDEIYCSRECSEGVFYCDKGGASVCLSKVCDGKFDCSDRSDELYCTGGRTTPRFSYPPRYSPTYPPYSAEGMGSYTMLSILMPLLAVGVITISLICMFVLCIVRRRRALLSRRRVLREMLRDRNNQNRDNNSESSFSLYNPNFPLCPPSYEDALSSENGAFNVTEDLDTTLPPHPPAYNDVIKPDDESDRHVTAVPPAYSPSLMPPVPRPRPTASPRRIPATDNNATVDVSSDVSPQATSPLSPPGVAEGDSVDIHTNVEVVEVGSNLNEGAEIA